MADQTDTTRLSSPEEEIWITISAFEQILEAMPADRTSLEALAGAYEQIGDHVRAKDYFLRLAEVVLGEGDHVAGAQLARHLAPYREDPGVRDICERLETLVAVAPPMDGAIVADRKPVAKAPVPHVEPVMEETFNLGDELAFAWSLLENTLLTQEEYSNLVHDLTEMATNEKGGTISTLHVLEFRKFSGMERVMGAVSRDCGTPIISLSLFDVPQSAVDLLPFEFMFRRGALVFDQIGPELLVVVMNPHDRNLRKRVEDITRRKCHFYICLPSDFDRVVNRIREGQQLAKAEAKKT